MMDWVTLAIWELSKERNQQAVIGGSCGPHDFRCAVRMQTTFSSNLNQPLMYIATQPQEPAMASATEYIYSRPPSVPLSLQSPPQGHRDWNQIIVPSSSYRSTPAPLSPPVIPMQRAYFPDQHHPSLYYSDGNVALSARGQDGSVQYFRVHHSVLSRHSPVLADMFAMPPMQDETYDGALHVRMPDNAEDLASFLGVLYDPLYVPLSQSPMHRPDA